MSMHRTALVAFLAFATFAQRATSASNPPASPQAAEARSAPERVAADTPRVTPGGAAFTVPSGWSIVTGKNLVILEPPEADTHVAIVDSPAADASAAVADGWAVYKPDSKRPLKLVDVSIFRVLTLVIHLFQSHLGALVCSLPSPRWARSRNRILARSRLERCFRD